MHEPYSKIYGPFRRTPDGRKITTEFARDEFRILMDSPCWEANEKIDGTNIRLTLDDGGSRVFIGGRTDKAQIPGDLLDTLREIGDRMVAAWGVVRPGMTLYGEGYGAGIQKGGGHYRKDKGFILFDVAQTLSSSDKAWLPSQAVAGIAGALNIPHSAIEYTGKTLRELIGIVTEGFDSTYTEGDGRTAEGLVARAVGIKDYKGDRIMCKLKNNQLSDPVVTDWLGVR